MDSDQRLIDEYNAREEARKAAEWKQEQAAMQRYENAAKEAHKVRMNARVGYSLPTISWDDLHIGSQRHLIADAECVAKNPSITERELRKLYQERLVAWGDTGNPDLEISDKLSEIIEGMVLVSLKAMLNRG